MLKLLWYLILSPADEGGGAASPSSDAGPSPGGQGTDWGSLTNNAPGISDAAAQPATSVVEAVAPTAPPPQPAPAPQSPAQAPPGAIQPHQPPTASVEAAPAAPVEPSPDALDPQWQERGLAQLTSGYRLSDEQRQQYEDNPTEALPGLAARLHMNVLTQGAAMLDHWTTTVVPKLITQALQQQSSRTKVETAMETRVFSRFPEMRQVPKEVMQSVATVLRQRMPNASFEEGMGEAARIVYGMYGWQLPGQAAPAATPPAPQPQAQPAYTPAVPGAVPPAPLRPNGAAPGGNPFADLIDPR